MTLEKVVPSIQVKVLLPLSRNPSSHDTCTSVPLSTGNVVSVLRLFQAGSTLVHCTGPTEFISYQQDLELRRPHFIKQFVLSIVYRVFDSK